MSTKERTRPIRVIRMLLTRFPFVSGDMIDANTVDTYMVYKGFPAGTRDLDLLNDMLSHEFGND